MTRPSETQLQMQAISTKYQGTALAAHGLCRTRPQMEDFTNLTTNFLLLDAKNDQIWAIANRDESDRLEQLICRGLLYTITNFKIIAATGPFKPIDTTKTIVFGARTVIEDSLHGSSVPLFAFTLRSGMQILPSLNKIATLTDAGGIIIDTGDLEYKRNDIRRVDVTLIDGSLAEIHVSLWGENCKPIPNRARHAPPKECGPHRHGPVGKAK
ncbi:hypothetical protein POM88_008422 [Heracleum sosnowskyi]|uniref:Replication protein A OB domain-containing protein n=1 Tax=Heracleum sosnowskyi TaxID=360622 RepID=A0AAD8J6M4_9APIA|nr:hypothetical protein POM88_008422 [Heracleum sosnowskyi]